MYKQNDEIEWGKMTRNIQSKENPSVDRSQVQAPTGFWVQKEAEVVIKKSTTEHLKSKSIKTKKT